jgi:hypothetical protein
LLACSCTTTPQPHPWLHSSTFNIPFSRSASFDDNLAFFKEVLAELHRWVAVGNRQLTATPRTMQ